MWIHFENLIAGMLPFVLTLLCGIYLSFKGRFFQFTKFFETLKLVKTAFKNNRKSSESTSYKAACTALSATVGTGNIAGVASAVTLGGAGAVFWMWVSAFMGVAVKYAEIALSIKYREKNGGDFIGGPMYYIKNALPKSFKFLSLLFAVAALPAVFFSGNITQTNAAVEVLAKGNPRIFWGAIFAVLTALVSAGGIKRIGNVTELLVPLMSVIYTVLAFGIIIYNIDFLPKAFKMIIAGAFSPKAVTGGAVGSVFTVMMTGASRGIFSNEAGLGTSAMAHSCALDANADTQGLFGVFEVFIDTIVMCTLTALMILCSNVSINYGSSEASLLAGKSMALCYGKAGYFLLSVMMAVFAFSSIIGWAVYGNICVRFFMGKKGEKIFNFLYPVACIAGAAMNTEISWRLSAFFNGIMLCVNVCAILLLADKIFKIKEGNQNDRESKKLLRNIKRR